MKVSILLLVAVVVVSPLFAEPSVMDSAQTREFIARLASTQSDGRTVTARFREVRTSPMHVSPIVVEGTIEFRDGGRFRRTIEGPRGSVITSDGETLWIYFPQFNEVEVYNLANRGPAASAAASMLAGFSFGDIDRNFDATAIRTSDGFELRLTPKTRRHRRMVSEIHIRIGRDLRPIGAVIYQPDETRSEVSLSGEDRVERGDDWFGFDPPAGARVTRPLE